MRLKKISTILFVCILSLGIYSCSSDDNPISINELTLEKSAIEIEQRIDTLINITNGNGEYKVETTNKEIATASITDNKIKITAISSGETQINVTDKQGKKATIKVAVFGIVGTWTFVKTENLIEGVSEEEKKAISDELDAEIDIKSLILKADRTFTTISQDTEFPEKDYEDGGVYTYKDKLLRLKFELNSSDDDDIEIFKIYLSPKTLKLEEDRTDVAQSLHPNSKITKAISYIYFDRKK